MHFSKMQGVGNDFVVVSELDAAKLQYPYLARFLCRRHFSIGADGLLVIGQSAADAAFTFRMFNPDGSEDMCGNGLRCAALWAFRRRLVSVGDFTVETKDGPRQCNLVSVDHNVATVIVDMGPAHFESHSLPIVGVDESFINRPIEVLDKSFPSTIVNTGSTHTVVFTEAPVADSLFFKYSPIFEELPMFPERTSVIWTRKTGDNHFDIRIWERGAGETLGCGTGACAAGVAAVVNHKAQRGEPVVISSKGGDLTITWGESISMSGPAALVFEGEIDVDLGERSTRQDLH